MLYGRPEQIGQTMINRIRAIPPPDADRLDTLINFGLSVQNLCCHLKAVSLVTHLSNPILLQELVCKLLTNVKLNWALHRQQFPTVYLSSFVEFLASAASSTVSVVPYHGSEGTKKGGVKTKGKVYLNSHLSPSKNKYCLKRAAEYALRQIWQ